AVEADEEHSGSRLRWRLRTAECVECVVQWELPRHIVEVVAASRLKAGRRGVQPRRFRREGAIVRVGTAHDIGKRHQRRIRELVPLDERIEGAPWTAMTQLDVRNIIRDCVFAVRDVPNSIRRHKQELWLRIDEARDQPRTGDAIYTRTLAGDPLHGDLLFRVKGDPPAPALKPDTSAPEAYRRAAPGCLSLFIHRDR